MKAMYRLAFEAHKKGLGFYPLGSLAGIDLQQTGKSPGFDVRGSAVAGLCQTDTRTQF